VPLTAAAMPMYLPSMQRLTLTTFSFGVCSLGCFLPAATHTHTPHTHAHRITVTNKSAQPATVRLVPQFWFRNTWIWGCTHEGCTRKPMLRLINGTHVTGVHESLGTYRIDASPSKSLHVQPQHMFTENETNTQRLYGSDNYTHFTRVRFAVLHQVRVAHHAFYT
jgi:hypothetical protein